MELLSTDDTDLERAAAAIARGLLVAFPTETVYGLGADAFNVAALAKVFAAKNRPRFDPLIVHIAEYDFLPRVADLSLLDPLARERLSLLSQKLWPGPLTLILPKRSELPSLATAGLATTAVRFPSDPVAQAIISRSTGAVAAPSANPFGCLSPTRAEHVIAQLGAKVDFIVDGGRTSLGVESTVLDLSCTVPCMLRPGGTPVEAIEELIGKIEFSSGHGTEASAQVSPGLLKSHYAPKTPLVLYRAGTLAFIPDNPDEGRLYFSPPESINRSANAKDRTRFLSQTGDLGEAAANLFDILHELDKLNLRYIRAEEAPNYGLGLAINDRLQRAGNKGM